MFDINGIAAILAAVFPALASIVVVILQLRAERKQKNRQDVEEMREQLRAKDEQDRTDMLKNADAKIDKLAENLESLAVSVEKIDDKQERTDRTVRQLTNQMKVTTDVLLNHQRATAEVLNTVAEGFRDNKLSGNVTAAIEKYHNIENKMLQDAIKSVSDTKVDDE